MSYRNAAGWWSGEDREALGFTVQHADSWVFAGTGLTDGTVIGREHHLVGFECDGAALGQAPSPDGKVVPSYADGTPKTFQILGWAQLTRFGNGVTGWATESREPDVPPVYAATMGLYTNNGTVFNGATTDWVRVVVKAQDAHVTRITLNVLDRLSSRSSPLANSGLSGRSLLKCAAAALAFACVSARVLQTKMTRRQVLTSAVLAPWGALVARKRQRAAMAQWLKKASRLER